MKQAAASVSYSLIAVIIALIAAQALFVGAYVDHEHTIYFWDHAMYVGMARQAYANFARDFSVGWAGFWDSFAGNYNLIYALPSFLSFFLFGPTRLVFILTNFFVFFLAYEMAAAFFLHRALKLGWSNAFVISLLSCLLIPPLWLPLLEGYPDIGAAACILFAAGLAWENPGQPRTILRALAVGFVLGLAVLLRRHFIYPVFALLAVLAGFALWNVGRERRDRGARLKRVVAYFLCCGIGLVSLLALIAPGFLRDALTTDYSALYLSYRKPAGVFLRFILGGFGYGLLLMTAAGLVLLARTGKKARKLALFAVFYTSTWLFIWCLGPGQMGHHYILHALPLLVIAGLTGWVVYPVKHPRIYALGAVAAFILVVNSAWALWISPTGVWPNDNGTPGFFSAPRPPVVRSDYDELLRFADYLRRTTKPDDRIMVVGSSFILNLDLMHSIYMDILGAPDMTLRFPKTPEIDHEEPAPFNAFAGSDIYLVPTPPQYHLDPEGQRVITAAANQFPPPAARAGMFHRDDAVFHLADGVTVNVWRRGAWTPAALFDALADIRRDGPQDAGFRQDWAASRLPLRTEIRTNAQGFTSAFSFFDPQHRDLRLFFDYPLGTGDHRLALLLASGCPDTQLRLSVVTAGGHIEVSKDLILAAMPGPVSRFFTVPASPDETRFLELDLSTAPAALCRMEMQGLNIEKTP